MPIGVSPMLFYDPVGRVVATLHPDHTWEKVVFDPWRQETWDVNDTVAASPTRATDPDVGGLLRAACRTADYLPTWYAQRAGGALGAAGAGRRGEGRRRTPTRRPSPTSTRSADRS